MTPSSGYSLLNEERAETAEGRASRSLPFSGKAGPPSPVALGSTVEVTTTGALAPPSSPTKFKSKSSGGSGGTGSLCHGELAGCLGYWGVPTIIVGDCFLKRPCASRSASAWALLR